jgi:hypothetical protein
MTYSRVSDEDRCENGRFDEQGNWYCCPDVGELRHVIVQANKTEANGKHYCDECKRVCLALRKDDFSQGLDQLEVTDSEDDADKGTKGNGNEKNKGGEKGKRK